MSQVKYYTISLTLEDEHLELLSSLKHDGVEEYAIDEAEVDRLLGEKAFSGGDVDDATISLIESQLEKNKYLLYFHGEGANHRAQESKNILEQSKISYELSEHVQQDWNEKWREGYETVKVSDKLWVIPSWHKSQVSVPAGVTPLYLYPGQGFGTGRHETTSLCLSLFENSDYKNKTVLDFGCGSGILGIAAKLRHGCDVVYTDIDQSALDNTIQNLEENNIEVIPEKIVKRSQFKAEKTYDLIFANILLEILIKEKNELINCMSNDSTLIVSGLLNEHKVSFLDSYPELQLVNSLSLGDWCALELRQK